METRFAGAHRVDERRRRRLATESEVAPLESSPPDQRRSLKSSPGAIRFVHTASASQTLASPEETVVFPISRLIPSAIWKHVVLAIACFGLGAGILALGHDEVMMAGIAGPRVAVFCSASGRLPALYSSLLVLAAAQLSLLIWWVRSQSLRDFDGRYRVWKKTGAILFLFSFCIAAGAHHAWSDACHWLLATPLNRQKLYWMVPAAAFAISLVAALHHEMRACRASLSVLYVAAVSYLLTAVLDARVFEHPLLDLSVMALQGLMFLGHVSLVLSLTLHARHVTYLTAEPNAFQRRKLNLRIPRPHFRLRWPLRRAATSPSVDVSEPAAESAKPESKKRRSKTKDESKAETKSDDKAEIGSEPVKPPEKAPARAKSRIRIDLAQMTPAPVVEACAEPAEQVQSAPSRPANEGDLASVDQDAAEESYGEATASDDQTSEIGVGQFAEDEDQDAQAAGQSDFSGLSKKQRRRLAQEQRDRERSKRR